MAVEKGSLDAEIQASRAHRTKLIEQIDSVNLQIQEKNREVGALQETLKAISMLNIKSAAQTEALMELNGDDPEPDVVVAPKPSTVPGPLPVH